MWPPLGCSFPFSLFFLNLFISPRDSPQRRCAGLSDLNKCLPLEGCLVVWAAKVGVGARVSPPPRAFKWVFLKGWTPSYPFLFVTLSLWHLFLMAWEMRGRATELSLGPRRRRRRGQSRVVALSRRRGGSYLDGNSLWLHWSESAASTEKTSHKSPVVLQFEVSAAFDSLKAVNYIPVIYWFFFFFFSASEKFSSKT